MRVVLDTNTVISGFLWGSYPRQILDLVWNQQIEIYTSSPLIEELLDVLSRPKFAQRLLAVIQETPEALVNNYINLVQIVEIHIVEKIIINDPDDDQVLACAVSSSIAFCNNKL
ncbi:putative toxin-antitoxin system toxin component, PIN family [Planktothrix sp. FACHB-1365]|uniref:putative toxin-antitoxin system toxin component, PIN family n=1 Tax=Planktothrix sp. FACHB-1365 TaxID=2692855 RepID=UPI001687B435|nr:putative toxin-antitoxin system toxin component, PIN family [Planktothrix sp. FACHB-1365]MBD2484474.1 putative toxin-antitoxin system toxin component, PIN family [Planktothrix sp. FACHB-1365]